MKGTRALVRIRASWTRLTAAMLLLALSACGDAGSGVVNASPSPPPAKASIPPITASTTPHDGEFWLPDQFIAFDDRAFGRLSIDTQPGPTLRIGQYELATALPSVPAAIDVLLIGNYPEGYDSRLKSVMPDAVSWHFIPQLALLQYTGPPIPVGPMADDRELQLTATEFLRARGVLANDSIPPTTQHLDNGARRFLFNRRVGEVVVYANKAVGITIDARGLASNVIGRRRPILGRSAYPMRAPVDAWESARSGRALSMYLDDGSLQTGADLERFVVVSVELAYAEVEVRSPRDVLLPYYVFRGADGHALYVPAVADPFQELPPVQR